MKRYRIEWLGVSTGFHSSALVLAHTAADAKLQAEVRLTIPGMDPPRLTRLEPTIEAYSWDCPCGTCWRGVLDAPICQSCGRLAVPMWLEPAP